MGSAAVQGQLWGRHPEVWSTTMEQAMRPVYEAALDALYRSADVLLSVHRAEGFGLPLREAMSRGIPVVATGWSGNLEFMDDANSLLVPCRLIPVSDASAVYGSAGTWADPDLETAALLLRRLASGEPLTTSTVGDFQGPPFTSLEADAPAREAFTLFSSGQPAVAIISGEHFEGIITRSDLLEFWAQARGE